MRKTIVAGLAGLLLSLTGCSPSPEAVAKEYVAAMKSSDVQGMMNAMDKMKKFSKEELQQFFTAVGNEMPEMKAGFGQMGEMMKNFGGMPKQGGGFGGFGNGLPPAGPAPGTPQNQGDFFGGNKN